LSREEIDLRVDNTQSIFKENIEEIENKKSSFVITSWTIFC